MAADKARPVDPITKIDGGRLDRLGSLFVEHDILNKFGVTFAEYLAYVASGMCHYYAFCKGADKV